MDSNMKPAVVAGWNDNVHWLNASLRDNTYPEGDWVWVNWNNHHYFYSIALHTNFANGDSGDYPLPNNWTLT